MICRKNGKGKRFRWHRHILGMCTFISAVSGILCAYLQYAAKPSSVLSPRQVQVSFGSHRLASGERVSVYLGTHFSDNSSFYLGSFPLVLHNAGESTIRKISVVSTFPKRESTLLFRLTKLSQEGPLRRVITCDCDRQATPDLGVLTWTLNYLNPDCTAAIYQPMALHTTQLRAYLGEVGDEKFYARVDYALVVDTRITAEHSASQSYTLDVQVLNADSRDNLQTQVSQRIRQEMIENRNAQVWWQRFLTPQYRRAYVGFAEPALTRSNHDPRWFYVMMYNPQDITQLTFTSPPAILRILRWVFCLSLTASASVWLFFKREKRTQLPKRLHRSNRTMHE